MGAATLLGTAVFAVAPSAAAAPPSAPTPLRIMLTNDDGYAAPGLAAVRAALVAAGHEITVVAPLVNQSGAGARATFGGSLQVTHPSPDTYAVDGSPADATEVGLSFVFADAPPDLVISGSNAGQNVAAGTIHSGTVGAAVTAIEEGVPAIAVSTEAPFPLPPSAPAPPYAETAAFVVDLVGGLQEHAGGGRLLPEGTGLNVSYPIVEDGSTPRPRLTETGRGAVDLSYSGSLPGVGGTATLGIVLDLAAPETLDNADSTALFANQIPVTVIEGDYDADRSAAVRRVARVVHDLAG
jgi:5'/3'-nucleotidase SurE